MNFSDAENAESPRYNMDSSKLFVSVSDNQSSDTDIRRLDKTELIKRISETKNRQLNRTSSGEIRYKSIMNLRSNEGGEHEDEQNVQKEIKEFITRQSYKYTEKVESDEGNEADEELSAEEKSEEPEVKQEKKDECNIF